MVIARVRSVAKPFLLPAGPALLVPVWLSVLWITINSFCSILSFTKNQQSSPDYWVTRTCGLFGAICLTACAAIAKATHERNGSICAACVKKLTWWYTLQHSSG